jgi:ubiquinone biosynthesis protein
MDRIVVATDRSDTAERAVEWAADLARRFGSELVLVQVLAPDGQAPGSDTADRAIEATEELSRRALALTGANARGRVVIDPEPADAVVAVAVDERADVIVVGNFGMSGRKKFLLSNIPNRITHIAPCTVITVNTALHGRRTDAPAVLTPVAPTATDDDELLLTPRGLKIGRVAAKHGLSEVFARRRGDGTDDGRESARRLRTALEELGPTFCKLGQILSTRPDLVPPVFIEELSTLRDNVPQLTEAEVVEVMEQELRVPWEDVFESIDPQALATGTIAQVHRATLANGERVVLKVQRPNARGEIMRDLGLLEAFAFKSARRAALRQVIDPAAVVEHLSESLKRELDFRQEAANIERMRGVLEPFDRLGVPAVYNDFSTSRLLVMEEVQGGPITDAPEGAPRQEAARQLIESYYRQILGEGFFHADPHPGNLKWWDGRVYFLDFGMIGEVGNALREGLLLLLLAFWQEDTDFLADTLLMLSGDEPRHDLNLPAFREDIAELVNSYRHLPLREIQLGPMLQDITTIAIRHDVALPAGMMLTAKALAQIQHATAELDPDLDPFSVAGSYLARNMLGRARSAISPQNLLYESQKLRVRVLRLVEAFERLAGARPGANLQVQFRGIEGVEPTIRRAARRLSVALAAGAAIIGTALTADSTTIASWVAPVFGAVAAFLTGFLLVDVLRRSGS